jgi:hypothetical protein
LHALSTQTRHETYISRVKIAVIEQSQIYTKRRSHGNHITQYSSNLGRFHTKKRLKLHKTSTFAMLIVDWLIKNRPRPFFKQKI